MARGNWQKRVERTEARRMEAKQKKHRSEEKRIFKSMAHDLLGFLDRQMDAVRQRSSSETAASDSWKLHLWTDSVPSAIPPFLDTVETEDPSGKANRRTRSVSMDDNMVAPGIEKLQGRKGRGRSGSFQQEGKKVHPRSNQGEVLATGDPVPGPLLCRSQFFHGKCLDPQRGGKKGGCRCLHYSNKQFKTLAAVLVDNKQKNEVESMQRTCLELAEEACEANTIKEVADLDPGAMEMAYYLSLPVYCNIVELLDKDDEGQADSTTFSNIVTAKLNENQLGIGSIVYLAMSSPSRHVLLYDRNQNGLVIEDLTVALFGSAGADGDAAQATESHLQHVETLPASILEHILLYLDAPAVASASLVCASWHREISNASPNLWLALLNQRSWPLPSPMFDVELNDSSASLQDPETSTNVCNVLRNEFVKHYSVYRDIKAIQKAMTGLLTKRPCEQREMTFQAFSARRNAPQAPNNCVAVEIWGPNQVLAAYSNDCTLRLFQAVHRGGHHNNNIGNRSHNEKLCRELVCLSIDPYARTKKKSSFMEAMSLDEDVVGCLLSVSDEASDYKTPHILVILRRDDILLVDSSAETAGRIAEPEEGAIKVIDVENAVLNYILSLDQVDHRLLRLNDFLALGGESCDIEFIVSQSMAACGYGRFMVEVAISIPINDDDDENLAEDMLLIDRKLFLFSSSVGAIVWMGDSNPPDVPLPSRLEDMTIACMRRSLPGSNCRSCCTVAAVSHALAPMLMSCEIDYRGHIEGHYMLGSTEWSQTEMALEEGWNSRPDGRRPIVVTPTDIVVGDTLTRRLDGAEQKYKSIVTFYSRFPSQDERKPISKLVLGENCTIDRMTAFRYDYVVLLVRFFPETGFAAVDGGGGHWGSEDNRVTRVHALTIHVPSRREIERLCLFEDFGVNKLTLAVNENTVACGVWLKGIIITGDDVRSVEPSYGKLVTVLGDATTPKSTKKKGKSKLRPKSGGKKDGFARGMSLRG